MFSFAYSGITEAIAYEKIWAKHTMHIRGLSKIFSDNTITPSKALSYIRKPLDTVSHDEIAEFVKPQIEHSEVLVSQAYQYPKDLHRSKYKTPLLYAQGNIDLLSGSLVSVVGTRSPSKEGAERTRKIVMDLMNDDIVIVSGLAEGIDTIAHQTAIQYSGFTIAVIGTPINIGYPLKNRELQNTIAVDHLLLSHVPIFRYKHEHFKSHRYYFPWRNHTMAAISQATIIVEAGDSSGTLIQARACLQQGKLLLLHESLLKRKDLQWPHKYVRQGAQLFSSASDVIKMIQKKPLVELLGVSTDVAEA